MMGVLSSFTLICLSCYNKDGHLGETHIHSIASGHGAFIRLTCFRCGNVDEVQVSAPEPKNSKDVKKALKKGVTQS